MRRPKESPDLITCHLTKLETALDQLRKAYPKMNPADTVLVASALTLSGRHALAVYDDKEYEWPNDYEKLTMAMKAELTQVQEAVEHNAPKRVVKTAPEEEPIFVSVQIKANYAAGERLLSGRDELKTVLSDLLAEPHEFHYQAGDIGWQWALDRAGWHTILGERELSRRVKIKVNFIEPSVGSEIGAAGPKKRPSRAKAAPAPEAPAEVAVEAAAEPVADAEE